MRFGKSIVVAAIFALTVVCSVSSRADEPVWVMRPVEKLARGIAGAAFCPLELPMQLIKVKNEHGGIAGITYGTLKGVCYVVARAVVGVVDVVTFPFPLPNCPNYPGDGGWGYGPIMKPAWVVPVESDWNGFVYDQTNIVNPAL